MEKVFEIRKLAQNENPKPKKKGTFSFYAEKEWHQLVLRPEFMNEHPVKGLDVELLTNLVIEPIFGMIHMNFLH